MNMVKITRGFTILLIALAISGTSYGQSAKVWHLKSITKDSIYGINLENAYDFLRKKKLKGHVVTVGIVDSGIDTAHEDLQPVLWQNKKEIGGNGKDDDKNGYSDDMHGWNFLGSRDGTQDVDSDSYEIQRIYWQYKDRFWGKDKAGIPMQDTLLFNMWKRAEVKALADSTVYGSYQQALARSTKLMQADTILQKAIGKKQYTRKELEDFVPPSTTEGNAKKYTLSLWKVDGSSGNSSQLVTANKMALLYYSRGKPYAPPAPYRANIVKDNEEDIEDRFYGNPRLGTRALHGTHVAGIIGAARNNGIGMDGIADHVQLMSVRAVPDGDEHDKDISLAIRYAVDNGAKVINMSFGKAFSAEKQWVDDAIRYAGKKNVLIVQAAGNDSKNIDEKENYPSPIYLDGTRAKNHIMVGATSDGKNGVLTAFFSNYGVKNVNVFAPGVNIYSTVPGNGKYEKNSGTSMAAPVVTGVAALLMSYFPKLSALQVKEIIERTVSKPATKVRVPGKTDMVFLSELCTSGGIVDAYEAVKLAAKTKPARKRNKR